MARTSQHLDMELARKNLLQGQVRTWDVRDPVVLASIAHLPREEFIAPEWQPYAFADDSLPLAHGETTMSPRIEARILQEISLSNGDNVLEIGTGCGYLTALMALTANRVDSFEWHQDICEAAQKVFSKREIDNINCVAGDGLTAAPADQTWDVIVIGGAVRRDQDFAHLKTRLANGGRIFAITGTKLLQQGKLFTHQHDALHQKSLVFSCCLPMLHGLAIETQFVF